MRFESDSTVPTSAAFVHAVIPSGMCLLMSVCVRMCTSFACVCVCLFSNDDGIMDLLSNSIVVKGRFDAIARNR